MDGHVPRVRSTRIAAVLTVFVVACLVVLYGCGSVRQIRVQNISTRNFTSVDLAGQVYGDSSASFGGVRTRPGAAIEITVA